MKKIIYYIALSVMCVLPFSCSDMLEEENRTEMEKKNYMNTAAEAEKVLLGIYSTLSTDNLYHNRRSPYRSYKRLPCNATRSTSYMGFTLYCHS